MKVHDFRPRRDHDGDIWTYNHGQDAWMLTTLADGRDVDDMTGPFHYDDMVAAYGPVEPVEISEVRLFFSNGGDFVSAPTIRTAFRLACDSGVTPEFAILY